MTKDETIKQLIEDLISAMEYHVEQTRPVHTTTVAIQAAKDALNSMPTASVQDQIKAITQEAMRKIHDLEDQARREVYNIPPAAPVPEPVAFFDPQGKGFYWAKPTQITAPVTVDVEPLPLYTTPPAAPVQKPVWIRPDDLQKAQKAPFLCRVEPNKRDDFVPLYAIKDKNG